MTMLVLIWINTSVIMLSFRFLKINKHKDVQIYKNIYKLDEYDKYKLYV